eukprot:655531-Pelagomonas_calceolata.AAC.23
MASKYFLRKALSAPKGERCPSPFAGSSATPAPAQRCPLMHLEHGAELRGQLQGSIHVQTGGYLCLEQGS